ncbi:hypothetical protein KEM48_000356 [Puccinia striiformis f. sp. tritici PST-130]|nr:hypothetical protein KEM48_000356 [Puccinia striiformis f. sp. tritici PST-130]
MSNIPRSPNGQFACQPLNQTPNSRIPPSAPILDLPQVRVQRGSGDSTTPLNFDDLSNQIIDDDEEEEVRSENLDGQEVVDSIRSGHTTPVPESSVPLTAETLRMPLSGRSFGNWRWSPLNWYLLLPSHLLDLAQPSALLR